jgi:formate-dependent nitrite reductase membrane component NrfD
MADPIRSPSRRIPAVRASSADATPPTDARHFDPDLADIRGEAADLRIRDHDAAWPIAGHTPSIIDPSADTYYDLPVVKSPPWKWYVPAYFYAGGLAGAAAVLAGVDELAGRHRDLGHRLRWLSILGEAAGGALLIADLGRPERFHHMLRVFRPTSPMNLGTWILSGAGASSALGLAWSLRRRRAPAALSLAGIATGAMLSTYTGVLLGNTAIPIWNASRRRVPLWFAASSAASLGAALEVLAPDLAITRRYATVAKAAQIATAAGVARAARTAGVAAPLRTGRSGALWRGAFWLGVASLAATLLPGRSRSILAGSLGTAAAILGRFAITDAGHASAADPRATFEPQRRASASRSI